MGDEVVIVALKYVEPYWQETLQCIEQSGLKTIFVDRDGVGSMTKAFNQARQELIKRYLIVTPQESGAANHILHHNVPKYLFFVTNICFTLDTVAELAAGMEQTGYAAIHPTHGSDHVTHRKIKNQSNVVETPFVEWTAPMVRTDCFLNQPLDEDHRYWYFDLIWSYQIKKQGYKVGVHQGASINHTYLLKDKEHPISAIRDKLRWFWRESEEQRLVQKYGADWKNILFNVYK